ncbi:MAG: N-formylglutamate amidohydrolase [Micavibrio sp.]|nr:N-formylglutamate amidohydrolase [Micavibrio sp.]
METTPPPFILTRPKTPALPVFFDSPHSGHLLPPGFETTGSERNRAILRDSYIDRLVEMAPSHGVATLVNPYDRIYIDLNSRETAVDPSLLRGAWTGPHTLGKLASAQGLGLITSALLDDHGTLHQLFNSLNNPTVDDIQNRIQKHYRPYYAAMKTLMDEAVQSHGFALHFNFHSTPREPFMRFRGTPIGDVIIGDRRGTTCHPGLTEFTRDFFLGEGLTVTINDPFAGGAIVETTGHPDQGRHSQQIELLRPLYMDEKTLAYDAVKGQQVQAMLGRFSAALGAFTEKHAAILRPAPQSQ